MFTSLRFAQGAEEVRKCLVGLIKSTDVSSIQNCVNVVRLCSSIPCPDTFHFLCSEVVPIATTALMRAAERVAMDMITSKCMARSHNIHSS